MPLLRHRDANETAEMQPDERVHLAVSPREALLLERFHNGKLLADLQTLYNVTITVCKPLLNHACALSKLPVQERHHHALLANLFAFVSTSSTILVEVVSRYAAGVILPLGRLLICHVLRAGVAEDADHRWQRQCDTACQN